MRQTIVWTNADPINWRIYATIGGNDLIKIYNVWIKDIVYWDHHLSHEHPRTIG